jgi:uncharacterized protein involved in tolerance to divalent cations
MDRSVIDSLPYPILAYITCPSEEVARILAKSMLEQHLIAGVNLIPQVISM